MNLLLAHADDGREVLPRGLADRAAAPTRLPRDRAGKELWDAGSDPDDLSAQPWAVVVPEGAGGDALAEALAPLVAARSAEMGREARVLRAPAGLDADAAPSWIDAAWARAWPRELDRPRYVLVAADYATLPPGFDAAVAGLARVGRLPFDHAGAVAAYVAKVLAAPRERAGLRVYVADDGTAATRAGEALVVAPTTAACEAWATRVGAPLRAERVADPAAGRGRAVLLSVSHGVGAPRAGWASDEARRREQGALVLGRGDRLVADDVRAGPFVEGGAWVVWACYGAGTPTRSAYAPWLRTLAARGEDAPALGPVLAGLPGAGEAAFASALAAAALANPRGPVAVVGHLDLAWTFAVSGEGGRPMPGAVEELVRPLVAGSRAGLAMEALTGARAQADTLLALAMDRAVAAGEDPTAAVEARARLWLRRHDLAGWVLLGDPAARAGERVSPARGRPAPDDGTLDAPPLPPLPPPPTARPPLPALVVPPAARPALPPLPSALEDAILDLLRGEGAPADLARSAGVPLAELRALADAYGAAGRAAAAARRGSA